ncbi:MAG: rhodanese-like domain-containing protein [Flavobacteriaceae bacterium]|nr:rhodanese-like domain-containing protein [Flavobacteriaceae bacterium]MCB0475116.1 rhodanese-like domain-containing protein [Flavobacteriaceae bacterium]
MKKLSLFLIGLLLIPSLFLTSCDRGDDLDQGGIVAEKTFDVLKDYMTDNSLDINNITTGFVTPAPDAAGLNDFLSKYYILDIRSASAFSTSHIEGAKNIAFADILTEATNAGGKPILMVCYTGQTACYATALLRLYGYTDTVALKWGMSGWNSETAGPWNSNIGDIAKGSANWTNSAAPTLIPFTDPDLGSTSKDGETILKERVEAVVADGFKTVTGAEVLNSPSSYFINNFFTEAAYTSFGHIANAYRISPLTLTNGEYKNLNPSASAKVVTYCYTGQTSAVVTAVLRVLGYDAYSLTFGMNGLYHSNPSFTSNQWGVDSNPKELPLIK